VAGIESHIIVDEVGGEQLIKFSRPIDASIKIRVFITPLSGYSFSTETLIKNALVDYLPENTSVGGNIINSDLYSPLNEIGGFSIEKIELGQGSDIPAEKSIYLNFNERLVISTADIEVI